MSLTVLCPHCGKKLVANERVAGQEVGCPSCKGRLVIPASAHPETVLPAIPVQQPAENPLGFLDSATLPPTRMASNLNSISCPHCKIQIATDPRVAGKEVVCPHCNGRVIMPPGATRSQPPPLPLAASVKQERAFSELAAVGRGPSQVTLNLPHGSAQPVMEPPALWNPAALGIWSFFLSWAFGSFLVAKNWRALGDNAKASRAMIWFYAFFPYILIATITPTATAQFFRLAPIGVFVAWMFVECSPQQQLVEERFGKKYPRKSWGAPFGIAALAIGAVVALNLVAHPGLLDSGDVTAVKTGHLSAYPHSTIGEAVATFMGSPQWESGVANDGLRFVNVRGQVTYMDKPVSAVLQFEIHADGKNFEVGALEFNGVPQNNLIKLALLAKMFEGN